MTRKRFLLHCLLVCSWPLMSMIVLFLNKAKSVELHHRLEKLERQLVMLDEEMKVVEAEYAYQTTPAKIEALLRQHLGVERQRLNAGYVRNLEQLRGFFAVRQEEQRKEVSKKIKYNFKGKIVLQQPEAIEF